MPLFFNRKVVKPVKGGGKGVPTVNPYGGGSISIRPQSQPLSFNDFASKQNASSTAPTKLTIPKNKITPAPPLLGNMNAPIIKPEY